MPLHPAKPSLCGYANMPDVVTCILIQEEKILVLKRSNQVNTYQGKWACISGYIEPGDDVMERAYIEIKEETGLHRNQVQLLARGDPIEFHDTQEKQDWRIHSFLFSSQTNKVVIDWEHETYAWITLEQLDDYDLVPKLKETVRKMLP